MASQSRPRLRATARITTALAAVSLALAGCATPVAGPSGLYAHPIGDAPVTSNPTPYSRALARRRGRAWEAIRQPPVLLVVALTVPLLVWTESMMTVLLLPWVTTVRLLPMAVALLNPAPAVALEPAPA